ncbi:hypothetical protein [Psychroserpens algicola]|uniref:hypothetical protein n=1 Tax=Psychroserpens algicola TaxID=1719034 RepID=UPI001954D3EE|nr:hypothetical protein [Psychroserpens algicola]
MTNKTYLKLIGIFIFSFIMFSSCSSDDDSNNDGGPGSSAITDKWWYDSNNFAADIYFNSNGNYEQYVDFSGLNATSTGDWEWEDESAGIIKVTDLTGSGQTLSEVFLKISDANDSSMTVQQSINGEDFSIEVFYVDVEPEDN